MRRRFDRATLDRIRRAPWEGWALALALPMVLSPAVLEPMVSATRLTPSHDVAHALWIAGAAGAVCGLVTLWKTNAGHPAVVVLQVALAFAMAMGVTWMPAWAWCDFDGMRRDFPPARTRTWTQDVPVVRVIARHDKSSGHDVEIQPWHARIAIPEADFHFMQLHRRADDLTAPPDEVKSEGWFCARLTFQQSGPNVRVLNHGPYALRAGTVRVCKGNDDIGME